MVQRLVHISLNGYDDWYLPSQEELVELYKNKDVVGGFTADKKYCSSTMAGYDTYYVKFSTPSFTIGSEQSGTYAVRPIRSL